MRAAAARGEVRGDVEAIASGATALELREFLEDAVSEFSDSELKEFDQRLAADEAWTEPPLLEASADDGPVSPASMIRV